MNRYFILLATLLILAGCDLAVESKESSSRELRSLSSAGIDSVPHVQSDQKGGGKSVSQCPRSFGFPYPNPSDVTNPTVFFGTLNLCPGGNASEVSAVVEAERRVGGSNGVEVTSQELNLRLYVNDAYVGILNSKGCVANRIETVPSSGARLVARHGTDVPDTCSVFQVATGDVVRVEADFYSTVDEDNFLFQSVVYEDIAL